MRTGGLEAMRAAGLVTGPPEVITSSRTYGHAAAEGRDGSDGALGDYWVA